jgi:hypothetical protein
MAAVVSTKRSSDDVTPNQAVAETDSTALRVVRFQLGRFEDGAAAESKR